MWIVFSGAGISRASGIPTFEERSDLRDKLDLDIWHQTPEIVWEAVWEMYEAANNAKPNPAHQAIAESDLFVITQNIDGLHQKAGTRQQNIIELHGNLNWAICQRCSEKQPIDLMRGIPKPRCACGGLLKPAVVLYKEPVYRWVEAYRQVQKASGLLVVGTSLTVSPAAELPRIAEQCGAEVYVINQEAEKEVPKLLREILPQKG